MHGPVRLSEIGIDRKYPIRAAADERERLESAKPDQAVQNDRFGEGVQLPVLVLELCLPEEFELPLLDGLPRQSRVAAKPRGTLRVEAARRPLRAPAPLCV